MDARFWGCVLGGRGARWSTVGGAANAESGSVKWGERFAFGTEQIKNEAVTPAKAGAHWPVRIRMSYFVYILASRKHGTLYVGVTNDLGRRIFEHRDGTGSKFTREYRVHRLVYAEEFQDVTEAIAREKAMKEWKRAWKVQLIEAANPEWNDLSEPFIG